MRPDEASRKKSPEQNLKNADQSLHRTSPRPARVRSAFGGGLRLILAACRFDRRPKAAVEKSGREGQTRPIRRQMSRLRYAPLDMTERAPEGFAKAA